MASQVGNNIRFLRKVYGETQEELGSIINVEKNTISYYESGKREPDRGILSAIAKHYGISTDELVVDDFSTVGGVGKIKMDYNMVWNNIDSIFPMFSSEDAVCSPHFNKAYTLHRKIFDDLKKLNTSQFDEFEVCINEYALAWRNEMPEYEAIANCMGILYLLLSTFQVAPQMGNTAAWVRQVVKDNPRAERILEEYFETGKIGFEIEEKFDCGVASETLLEMIACIKQLEQWNQLADYYLALYFVFGLRKNGLNLEINRRMGLEMMNAFAELGNKYARRYFRLIAKSSQIVNDKKD